jgi:hypothetical protein
MMKQIQQTTIRQRLEYLIDQLIERILDITDYFIVVKHITLSEWFLFALAFGHAAWFMFFGVVDANYDYYFDTPFWTIVFSLISFCHFVGFFFKSLHVRIGAVYAHSFLWAFLTILAAYAKTGAPAVPRMIVFTLLSAILVVRLSSEKNND